MMSKPSRIEDYIYVRNHIPVEICKEFITECNRKKWVKHRWHSNYTDDNTSNREWDGQPTLPKELDVMNPTPQQQNKVTSFIIKSLNEYQAEHVWPGEKTELPWINQFTAIRFNKYKKGKMMRVHYDNIHSIFDGKLKGIPIISIVGILNDNYEGGQFMLRDREIKLKTGDILLFPSGIVYPHGVKEIKKGVRYSFVSWAF